MRDSKRNISLRMLYSLLICFDELRSHLILSHLQEYDESYCSLD
jgi:hypothetical protein